MKTTSSLFTLLSLFSLGKVTFSSIDSSVENGEFLPDGTTLLFHEVKGKIGKGVHSQHLRALYEKSPCHNLYASLKYSQKEGSDSLSIALKLRRQSKKNGEGEEKASGKLQACKKAFYPWTEVVGVLNFHIPAINGEKEVRFPFYVDLDEPQTSFILNGEMVGMPLDKEHVIDEADMYLLDPSLVSVRISENREKAPRFTHASVASYDPTYFEEGKVVAFAFPHLSPKQTIYGQKAILHKQKHFKKLFKKEGDQTLVTVQVPNFSAETMTALLEFVHTGRVKQYLPRSWEELYKAAEAFEIEMLGGAAFVKRVIEAMKTHTPITEHNVEPSSPFYKFIEDINAAVQNKYNVSVVKSDKSAKVEKGEEEGKENKSEKEENEKNLSIGDVIARIVGI